MFGAGVKYADVDICRIDFVWDIGGRGEKSHFYGNRAFWTIFLRQLYM